MTGPDSTTPPVGEELHLPGPSIAPVLVSVGLVLLLLGLVDKWPVAILGLLLLVAASVSWIRHAHHELMELPPGD